MVRAVGIRAKRQGDSSRLRDRCVIAKSSSKMTRNGIIKGGYAQQLPRFENAPSAFYVSLQAKTCSLFRRLSR